MKKDVEFISRGEKCRGWLITPEQGKGPFPLVILAGGFCYVKEMVMPIYADFFQAKGLAALLFDYRNFGSSDGEVRQHINPSEQIEDYKNAITFSESLPEVDPERIGIWGISLSGAHVLNVGATDSRVKAIVSVVPMVDGWSCLNRNHGQRNFAKLNEICLADRRNRFKTGKSGRITMSGEGSLLAEGETLAVFPDPEINEVFSMLKRTTAPSHEHWCTIETAELFMEYNVWGCLNKIIDIPILMIVAEGDLICNWDEEIEVFNRIKSNKKELFIQKRTSHMKMYSREENIKIAAKMSAEFCEKWLIKDPYQAIIS